LIIILVDTRDILFNSIEAGGLATEKSFMKGVDGCLGKSKILGRSPKPERSNGEENYDT
jgi:hypothetical protein